VAGEATTQKGMHLISSSVPKYEDDPHIHYQKHLEAHQTENHPLTGKRLQNGLTSSHVFRLRDSVNFFGA